MCNDFGNHIAYAEYAEALRHLGMPIVAPIAAPNLEPEGKAFTLLTTTPGLDVVPIHSRPMVVLKREDWQSWLDLSKPEPEFLNALPVGSLAVEQVR